MKVIYNVYRIDDKKKALLEYVIMYGNQEHGITCNADELKKVWNRAIHNSKTKTYGDVALFRYGKLIRGIRNAQTPILEKKHNIPKYYDVWEYKCTKYK